MEGISNILQKYKAAGFLIPAGLVMLIFGIVLISSIAKQTGFKKVVATVSKAELFEDEHVGSNNKHQDATYSIYVKYTVDGKEYEEFLGVFSDLTVGTTKEVIYDPDDPTQVMEKSDPAVPIALIIGGAVALIAAVISILVTRRRSRS